MENLQSSLYADKFQGMASVVLENAVIRAEVVPELGGKIVSLRYKSTGKEWLISSGDRPLKSLAYGSVFTEADMSGWDECFPTINACAIGKNNEILLPDHGEVWSLPWSSVMTEKKLIGSVDGKRLPYRLTREIELIGTSTLRLTYTIENRGAIPLPFLWTAHPQFAIDEPTKLLLPSTMRKLLCVFNSQQGEAGSSFIVPDNWLITSEASGEGQKYYYPSPVSEAWSGLYGQQSNNYLLLKTDAATVPYWGVWVDKGMCNDRTTVALEPGIGYYDSLVRAISNGSAHMLAARESTSWHLDIVLGYGEFQQHLS